MDLLRFEASGLGANYVQVVDVEQSQEAQHCNEFVARGLAFDTKRPATSPTLSPAAAPRERRTTPSPLGSKSAEPGCLQGQTYPLSSTELPEDYAQQAPAGRLWSCDFTLNQVDASAGLSNLGAGQAYALRYQGKFRAPKAGAYRFSIDSSTASRVWIDGALAMERSPSDAQSGENELYLGKGEHSVVIEYVVTNAALTLNIRAMLPGAGIWVPFNTRPKSPFFAEQPRPTGRRALADNGLTETKPSDSGADDAWRKRVRVEADNLELDGRIYFRTASAEINRLDESEASLAAIADALRDQDQIECVEIQGHTDDRGTDEFNRSLSRLRSQSVRSWLVQAGIEPHRLSIRGFGADKPVGANDSEPGRANNRRVQFAIRKPTDTGACPVGDPIERVRSPKRHADAGEAQKACEQLDGSSQQLRQQLEPWAASHRSCHMDDDCSRVTPVECAGRMAPLTCTRMVVAASYADDLRVMGARADAAMGFCESLPEEDLVRTCGTCGGGIPRCVEGTCR